jgi:hypothetical protein
MGGWVYIMTNRPNGIHVAVYENRVLRCSL